MAETADIQTLEDIKRDATDLATVVGGPATAPDVQTRLAGQLIPTIARIVAEGQAAIDVEIAAAEAAAALAVTAAEAAGDVEIFDTKAAATAALGGLAEGQVVEVSEDEAESSQRTRYRVEAGALVFKLPLAPAMVQVATLAEAKALVGVRPGTLVRINDQDELFVVSAEAVGADNITTHFFDADLSAETTDNVAEAAFSGHSYTVNTGVALSHSKIDLSTVRIILTDAGEEMAGHYLHGHRINPLRSVEPQSPLIDIDTGRLHDPANALRTASTRAAGIGVKYRYNTTSKVLRRVAGPEWRAKWLPTWGAAAGDGVESGNWFCWLLNRAAAAGVTRILGEGWRADSPAVYYNNPIEIPEGMRLIDLHLKVPAGHMFDAWLLSRSSVPGTPGTFPLSSPNNRKDAFLFTMVAYACAVFPATNSMGHQLEDIRIDGDLYNQTEPWENPSLYATGNMSTGNWFQDTPVCGGHLSTNHQSREIPVGQQHEFFGHVYIGGFMASVLLGNANQKPLLNHGRLSLGGSGGNHPIYFQDIVGGVLDFDGCWSGDCLRVYALDVALDTFKARRHPEPMLVDDAAFTGILAASYWRSGAGQPDNLISYTSSVATEPWLKATEEARGHGVSPRRCRVEGGLIDLMAFGDVPAGAAAQTAILRFFCGSDNFDLSDMRIRIGDNVTASAGVFGTGGGNGLQQGPYDHLRIEDILIEVAGRDASAVQLWTDNGNNGGTSGAFSLAARNVQVRHLNPVGSMPEFAGPDGQNRIAGRYRFNTVSDTALEGAYSLSFAGLTGADLSGDYFVLNPEHPDAPTVTVWFQVDGAGAAPGLNATEIEVDVVSASTATQIATLTRAAIVANATANPWVAVLDNGEKLTLGVLKGYRTENGNALTLTVSGAGTATALKNRRYFEPHVIEWDRLIAPAPVAFVLMQIDAFDADHGPVSFRFRDCRVGAWESTNILGPTTSGLLNTWSAELRAALDVAFSGHCVLAYRDKAQGVSFGPSNSEAQFYHARHAGTSWDRGDGTFLYADRAGTYTFVSTGAETSFDIGGTRNDAGIAFTATAATDQLAATAHGFGTGSGPLIVTNSGGALPAGLSATTRYWAILVDANTIKLATSRPNAMAGIAVDITGAGTGTHSIARASDMLFASPPKAFSLSPMNANAAAILAEAAQEWRREDGAAATGSSAFHYENTVTGNTIAPNPRLRVSGFTALASGQEAKFRWSGSLNP